MNRTLHLRRETLAELAPAELGNVGGGQAITQNCNTIHFCVVPTLPLAECISK